MIQIHVDAFNAPEAFAPTDHALSKEAHRLGVHPRPAARNMSYPQALDFLCMRSIGPMLATAGLSYL